MSDIPTDHLARSEAPASLEARTLDTAADASASGQSSAKPTRVLEALFEETEAAISQAQIDELLGDAPDAQMALPPACDAGKAPEPQPYQFGDLQGHASDEPPHSMELLGDVELDLRIELGRTHMRLEDVLRLRSGSVVALDKLAGDPVDIYINDRLIAYGEVVVINDQFGIRVTALVGSGAKRSSNA